MAKVGAKPCGRRHGGLADKLLTPSPNAPARDDRAGGEYSTYRPDLLMNRPLALASDVSDLSWQVENATRRLGDRPGARGLEGATENPPVGRA
jgi:hypothetical protein